MSEEFYSTSKELERELKYLWRTMHWSNLPVGTVLTLFSFYALHWPGYSQVFDVILPFVYVSIHLVILIENQCNPERKRPTAAFYINLPRRPARSLGAALVFYLGQVFYYEILIGIGVWLKLGGADITPAYRLHPDMIVLPIVAVLTTLWSIRHRGAWATRLLSLPFTLLLFVSLVSFHYLGPASSEANNFFPPRALPLLFTAPLAIGMVAGLGILCWRARNVSLSSVGDRS